MEASPLIFPAPWGHHELTVESRVVSLFLPVFLRGAQNSILHANGGASICCGRLCSIRNGEVEFSGNCLRSRRGSEV